MGNDGGYDRIKHDVNQSQDQRTGRRERMFKRKPDEENEVKRENGKMRGELPRTFLLYINNDRGGKGDQKAEREESEKCQRIRIGTCPVKVQHNDQIKNTQNCVSATSAAKRFFQNRNEHISVLS